MSISASVLDPLGIFLAISGAKGDRLLFRYPFENIQSQKTRGTNPYALVVTEDIQNHVADPEAVDGVKPHRSSSLIEDPGSSSGAQRLRSLPDSILSIVFAYNVKTALYNQKFEVKIDDVIFVGHPMLVQSPSVKIGNLFTVNDKNALETPQKQHHVSSSSASMFHIVFALRAEYVTPFVVDSYHKLSLKLAIAINHEEQRCGYFSANVKLITSLGDMMHGIDPKEVPYNVILEQNALAMTLKKVLDDIIYDGCTSVRVNNWIQVSFCLLPKIHRTLDLSENVLMEQVTKMRPYHGILLLESEQQISSSLPIDASSCLVRFIRIVSPLKNFQQLAMEAGPTLSQIFAMAGHLIHWAKARLVFPVCETNVYALAPEAPTKVISDVVEEFSQKFPDVSLLEMLADFSLPQPLRDLIHPFSETIDSGKLTQIVIWCSRKNLLIQLHTYVYLIPGDADDLSYLQNETLNYLTLPSEIRKRIDQVPAAKDEQQKVEYELFIKLIPYFRGNAHLEEMMFNLNIKRSQLIVVLDKFRDVIVTTVHEDPNLPAVNKHDTFC